MNNKKESIQPFNEAEYGSWIKSINEKDSEIADSALIEINRLRERLQQEQNEKKKLRHKISELQDRLEVERYRLSEALRFFNKWATGFAELIKTPLNLEDNGHLRHHYFAMRDSCKNLVQSCRKKTKEIKDREKVASSDSI